MSLTFHILGGMATTHLLGAFLDDAQPPLAKVLDIHDRTMAACVAAYC